MTLLDDIISGATDDAVITSNLLRKVQVVAHRLGATEITAWVQSELNGYEAADALPITRKQILTPVSGTWAGFAGSGATLTLSPGHIPEDMANSLFKVDVRQSIAELEDLAALPADPGSSWDPMEVVAYNGWIEQGLAPGVSMMNLLSARKVLTRAVIRGIVNSARNTALDFALQLQTTNPDAGEQNGPTVADAPIAAAVYNVTNNITGHGTNVAAGDNAHLRSTVIVNDLASLLAAAKDLGLEGAATTELAAAVLAPAGKRPGNVAAFLAKVGAGSFAIGTSASGQVVADQLTPLINTFLGI
jgi:hypothetical protein